MLNIQNDFPPLLAQIKMKKKKRQKSKSTQKIQRTLKFLN